MAATRLLLIRRCRASGLSVQADAAQALQAQLRSEKQENIPEKIDLILHQLKEHIEREKLPPIITYDSAMDVLAELSKDTDDLAAESIRVLSAFDLPRMRYNGAQKQFFVAHDSAPGHFERRSMAVHGTAADKAALYRDRFSMVRQRVMRNPLFCRPYQGSAKNQEYVQLTPLDSLVGSHGHKCLIGMLTQVEEGVFYLEDLNARIPVDLSAATTTEGFFTEGTVVLAEGRLEDGVFHVSMMGFPPPETRRQTVAALGGAYLLAVGMHGHWRAAAGQR